MRNDEHKELWRDIFSGEGDFRETVLNQTLGRVRRRKRVRRMSQMAAMMILTAGLALWIWRPQTPRIAVRLPQPEATGLEMVSSMPLQPDMLVESRQGAVEWISSSVPDMAMVETSLKNRIYQEVNDEELLAFAEGKPAVLLRKGPHEAELNR
jgi:hypothetical protein